MPTTNDRSRQLLRISVAVSLVLLSTAIFIFSIQTVTARNPEPKTPPAPPPVLPTVVNFHVEDGFVYYFGHTGHLWKVSLKDAKQLNNY